MNPKYIWLDALLALSQGEFLYKGGDSAWAYHLTGVPNAVIVFDDLLQFGWIAPVDGDAGRRYGLTPAGRVALAQGAEWYRAQPLWRRLLRPRLNLPGGAPATA